MFAQVSVTARGKGNERRLGLSLWSPVAASHAAVFDSTMSRDRHHHIGLDRT